MTKQEYAVLTRKQFDRFVFDTGIFPESIETMGSLEAPGLGYGLSPAISFRNDDPDAIQSAYVTPLPLAYKISDLKKGPKRSFTEDDFSRIKKAVLKVYG